MSGAGKYIIEPNSVCKTPLIACGYGVGTEHGTVLRTSIHILTWGLTILRSKVLTETSSTPEAL